MPKTSRTRKARVTHATNRAIFSLHKASEGGFSYATAVDRLRAVGVIDVMRDYSIYVGHYGLSVPKAQESKASRALFGR